MNGGGGGGSHCHEQWLAPLFIVYDPARYTSENIYWMQIDSNQDFEE